MFSLKSRAALTLLLATTFTSIQADCPVEGPLKGTGSSPYWSGEMSIADETTFKVKNYYLTSDHDLFWYGLKPDGTNEKIYDVEQTKTGKNDDTDNMWSNNTPQDAVFTINTGKSLANYKEIQLWCVQADGAYGVGQYNPADFTLTSDSCTVGNVVDPNNNGTTNGTITTPPTNTPTNENAATQGTVSVALAGVLAIALATLV